MGRMWEVPQTSLESRGLADLVPRAARRATACAWWPGPLRGARAPRHHVPPHPGRGLPRRACGASRRATPSASLGAAATSSPRCPMSSLTRKLLARPAAVRAADARLAPAAWGSPMKHPAEAACGRCCSLAVAGPPSGPLTALAPCSTTSRPGSTPEYPDLQAARPTCSARPRWPQAAKAALERLPRWHVRGRGAGARRQRDAGDRHTPRVIRVKRRRDDPHPARRLRRPRVSVRSQLARSGGWDFGQNARNIREFLAALDQRARPAALAPGAARGGRLSASCACLFCEIVAGKIPARVAYEDDTGSGLPRHPPAGARPRARRPQAARHEPHRPDPGRRRGSWAALVRRATRPGARAGPRRARLPPRLQLRRRRRATASSTSTCTSWAAARSAGRPG